MATGPDSRNVVRNDATLEAPGRHARPSLEARLLRRLLSSLDEPSVEFELHGRANASPRSVAGEAAGAHRRPEHPARLGARCAFSIRGRLQHGRIEVEGDLVELVSMVFRSVNRRSAQDSIGARVAGWLRRPAAIR